MQYPISSKVNSGQLFAIVKILPLVTLLLPIMLNWCSLGPRRAATASISASEVCLEAEFISENFAQSHKIMRKIEKKSWNHLWAVRNNFFNLRQLFTKDRIQPVEARILIHQPRSSSLNDINLDDVVYLKITRNPVGNNSTQRKETQKG